MQPTMLQRWPLRATGAPFTLMLKLQTKDLARIVPSQFVRGRERGAGLAGWQRKASKPKIQGNERLSRAPKRP
jgi:hypothetical protein